MLSTHIKRAAALHERYEQLTYGLQKLGLGASTARLVVVFPFDHSMEQVDFGLTRSEAAAILSAQQRAVADEMRALGVVMPGDAEPPREKG